MIKDESYVLSNGVKIPKVGLGTWQSKPNDAYNAVLSALKLGKAAHFSGLPTGA